MFYILLTVSLMTGVITVIDKPLRYDTCIDAQRALSKEVTPDVKIICLPVKL